MAPTERDNADPSTSSSEDRPSRSLRTTLPRNDKPLFTSRHNRGDRPLFRSGRSQNGEGAEMVDSKPRTRNWMSNTRGRGIGLGEAFSRTDENGAFLPRPVDRGETVIESRIPRTKTFSPSSSVKGVSLSPPRASGKDAYASKERAASVPVVNYESEDTGVRDGSPSPRPRPRDQRWSREESESDVSSIMVEDPTNDDFDQKMRQFSKDQERVKRILASQNVIFSRADVGSKIAETTRTLVTKTSASSLESEPPITVPRTWGSKARKNGDWMARILSPDTSLELKDTALEGLGPLERPTAVVDVPLPSIEDRPSAQEPTPPASRPASAQPNNASPEKSQMWDADLDFTAQSLQISTSPQLRVRSTKLDEIRLREIQSLTARAVATNRLEEIRERNSEDRSIKPGSAGSNGQELPPKETPEAVEDETFHERTILEEEGEHIRGTPITVFSAKDYESRSSSSSRERRSDHDRAGSSAHRREDPRDLLRRLSRATSSSPGPQESGKMEKLPMRPASPLCIEDEAEEGLAVAREPVLSKEPEKSAEKLLETSSKSNVLGVEADSKRHSRTSTPPKSDVDPEERITAEARLFELQDNKSERNSVRSPSGSPSPSDDRKFDETPKPKVDSMSLPTPRVTGAYIETPAPTARKPRRRSRSISPSYEVVEVADGAIGRREMEGSSSSAQSSRERKSRSIPLEPEAAESLQQPPKPRRRPPLINTANPTSAAEDLRRLQLEAQLEDSAFDDFDALLEADVTPESNTTILEPPLVDLEYDSRGLPLSKKEIERRIERLTLDRMNQSLKNTSTSIRDARHGIERLEHQVSSTKISQPANHEGGMLYIKIPVPRLWISFPGKKPSWKFTWLGLILSIFLAWYMAESAMCAQFCHPIQSTVNTWQPSDPFFPWAIPTKLDQWTGEIVSSTLGIGSSDRQKYGRGSGGSLGASDWWLGRDGPVGIVANAQGKRRADAAGSIFSDEMI